MMRYLLSVLLLLPLLARGVPKMKKAFALSGVVATAFLVIAAVNQVPQGGGGSATNAQPPSANLTNWSNVATGAYVRSSSGTGTNIGFVGLTTVSNILYRGNTTHTGAWNSFNGGGSGNVVSNIGMFVWGNENTSWGREEHVEGNGFMVGYRNYGGGDAATIADPWFVFGNYHTIGSSRVSFIAGGESNRVAHINDAGDPTPIAAFIGGGTFNAISNAQSYAAIGGGSNNLIRGPLATENFASVISGGALNIISNSSFAFISGGASNQIRGANGAGIVGEQITNTTANTLDLGMHNSTKVTIDETNTTVRGTLTVTSGSPGDGKVWTSDANGLGSWETPSGGSGPVTNAQLTLVIDGAGSAITTGAKGWARCKDTFTITGWDITADQSGSCVVDVWRDSYANFPPTVADTIAGSEKPTLSSQQKNQDASLSSWTTAVTKGDYIRFNVDSASTVQYVVVTIYGY